MQPFGDMNSSRHRLKPEVVVPRLQQERREQISDCLSLRPEVSSQMSARSDERAASSSGEFSTLFWPRITLIKRHGGSMQPSARPWHSGRMALQTAER
jgi:hypothetical protein